jgi:adenylate kinase
MLESTLEAVTPCISNMIPDRLNQERIAGRAAVEGRADDARPEVVENRIKTYHAKTEPLIEYYRKAGKSQELDGVGSIEEVRDRIFAVMDRF